MSKNSISKGNELDESYDGPFEIGDKLRILSHVKNPILEQLLFALNVELNLQNNPKRRTLYLIDGEPVLLNHPIYFKE